jgi:hypothetical protein
LNEVSPETLVLLLKLSDGRVNYVKNPLIRVLPRAQGYAGDSFPVAVYSVEGIRRDQEAAWVCMQLQILE